MKDTIHEIFETNHIPIKQRQSILASLMATYKHLKETKKEKRERAILMNKRSQEVRKAMKLVALNKNIEKN